MSNIMDWLEQVSVSASSAGRKDSPANLSARTQALKRRFFKNREAITRLKDAGAPALPGAVIAALNMIDLVWREMIPISRSPLTVDSPLAPEIDAEIALMHASFQKVMQAVPRALPARDPAEIIGAVLDLFDVLENIIVCKLSLLHRRETPDYFGGLDQYAVFPSCQYSAANRGRVNEFTRPEPDESFFRATKIGALIRPSPVIGADGCIYTGHADGEFVALLEDGSVKWRIRDKQMMYVNATGALGADGFLYMASADCDINGYQNQGRVWKIDPADGTVVWTFSASHFEDPEKDPHAQLSSFFEGSLALGEEDGKIFVYAGSDDNWLYKIAPDGSLAWEYDTQDYPSGVIWTKPLLSPDGETVFIGTLSGGLHAVSAATGKRRWMTRLGGAIASSPTVGLFGELFFGCFDGKIYAAAPEDGSVFWTYQTLGLISSSPAVAEDGSIVIGSTDGGVYCLDRFGKRRWIYYTDSPVKSSPAIDPEGLIYVGNESGKLYCLSPEGKRVWSLQTSPPPGSDLNCSPSLGADGTIYVGSTTGELFAVSRNFCAQHADDPRVSTDPGHDGKMTGIPPRGAALVFLDRFGVPHFDSPRIGIADNIGLAIFAADSDLNIVAAEIDPRTVTVEISPELDFSFRVESMGRAINIIPSGLLEYDTEYNVRAHGRYVAENEAREFDRTITLRTPQRAKGDRLPIEISDSAVSGIIIKGFTLSRPKELDALAQAALDAHNYCVAPIYIDDEKGIIVLAGSTLIDTGGTFEFAPKSVNRLVSSGIFKDSYFKVSGSVRVNARGADMPFDTFSISGRFTSEPGIADACVFAATSIHNIPEFADLLRVMRMADDKDEIVPFLTFTTLPFSNTALMRPEGVTVDIEIGFDRIAAHVSTAVYKAALHRIQFVLIDMVSGELILNNRVDIANDIDGNLTEVTTTIPAEARKGATAAVLVFDLFPISTVIC